MGDRDRAAGRGGRKGSARNRLAAEVVSITTVGNRVRLGLIGRSAARRGDHPGLGERLGLEVGARVTATWKAAATRLVGV